MPLTRGTRLGSYEVVSALGAGGMGEVYLARDTKLQRTVAIKVLSDDEGADARARLLHEARAASALNHPNICTVYEVQDAGERACIVMEHVEGQPLNEVIPHGGLPIDTVVRYGVQVADALAHAHDRGIIHRDLKSANVRISADRRAKLLDFGLAARVHGTDLDQITRSQARLDEAGVLAGTLAYMAPEVLHGQPADARSDIWALGVLLYEMASGAPPFTGETAFDLTGAVLYKDPPPLPPGVPPALRAVIQRCLAKDAADRYQRAGEVRAAIETIRDQTAQAIATSPARASTPRWPLAAAAALVVALLALAALNVGGLRDRRRGPGGPRIQSLAVLPLENLSRDPEQEYFADGMTEALITDLAKISALRVISRTSVMPYKGARKPLPEIGRALNVEAIIEGSVMRAGGRVRITTQLIRASTDEHLWADSYERDLKDVLEVQSAVARAVAHEIQITLTPQDQSRLTRVRAVDPAAQDAYLKGRYYWNKRTDADLTKAIGYFNQAIERDPGYVQAYAGLADTYNILGNFGALPPREAFPRARAAAAKALELDPNLAEAQIAMTFATFLYDREWAGADQGFRRALELNPNYGPGHQWYGVYLAAAGRKEESIREVRLAEQVDPLSLAIVSVVGWVYYLGRQYDQAIEQCRKAADMDAGFALAQYHLGNAYVQNSRFPEAIAALSNAVAASGRNPMRVAGLAAAYARAGRETDARSLLRELAHRSSERYVSSYEVAMAYAALGEKDRAFALLGKACEERYPWLVLVNVEPRLDSLRSDRRFAAVQRCAGLAR